MDRTQSTLRAFITDHWRSKIGGTLDWAEADPAEINGKTVDEAFELDNAGFVVIFTDRTVYMFGHRVTHDADWPECEVFLGDLPDA